MKQIFLLVMVAFFGLNSLAFAAEPCPPGKSCSENYMSDIPQDGKPAATKEEKKGATPEEQAAYMRDIKEASARDHDLIIPFSDKSLSESCYVPTDKYYKWLIANKDVEVSKKEISVSHFTWGMGSDKRPGCITLMVVHYHKK